MKKPTSIHAQWDEFSKILPSGLTPTQRALIEAAFWDGALRALHTARSALRPAKTESEAQATVRDLIIECERWVAGKTGTPTH